MSQVQADESIAELLTLTCEVDEDGTICYYNSDDQLHRIHGPAVIFTDGGQQWFRNGVLHRTNGPAVIHSDGHMGWYGNGQFIRDACAGSNE